MPLQHQLRLPRRRIPKLHAPVLAPAHNPLSIRRERHTKHEILVPFKRLDAFPALGLVTRPVVEPRIVELPHLDRLVQRSGHQVSPVGRESNAVHTVFVPLLAFGALDEDAGLGVPDANAFVQTAGCDEAVVGRDGDGGDAVFDCKGEDALVFLDVPEADGAVAGAGGDVAAVGGEVERVDVLLVAGELVQDAFGLDVPDL